MLVRRIKTWLKLQNGKPCSHAVVIITFCVSRRRRKMYCGHARLCVCVSVCLSVRGRMATLLHGPGCNLGSGRGCPLVVHYWADLQSVHGLRSKRGWLAGNWPSTGGVLNITAAAWTAGFLWWRSGNTRRTQNVSEYMLALARMPSVPVVARVLTIKSPACRDCCASFYR